MRVVDAVIFAGWIAFWLYWLAASVGVKSGQTGWRGFAGVRVAIVILLVLLLRLRIFRGHGAISDPWLGSIGLAVFVLGLALAVWARVYLGQNWGMPMTRKDDPELVTTGPYKNVRHPIYSGILLAFIGTAVAVGLYWLIAFVVLGAYFIYSAFMEERYMAERFPDTYPDYKRSTKMLIPYIL
jgi:protein-S-isoprenylcysteine O-methyltransferase Ste14